MENQDSSKALLMIAKMSIYYTATTSYMTCLLSVHFQYKDMVATLMLENHCCHLCE